MTPTLATLDSSVIIRKDATITLTGTRFITFATVLIGETDKEISVAGTIVSETEVTFVVPGFARGTYDLKV